MKFTPHAYQQYCIDRMINDRALGFFLDMGLGKTVISLTAINELKYNRFAIGRALVIAPKKVAESTWLKEKNKWDHLGLLRIVSVLGDVKKRVRALCTPGDMWVINRENVTWLVDYYRNDWPFDTVIIDESSSFKNHQAKRFKALCLVRPRIDRIAILTGTPAPNGLMDLWSQVFLLDGGERLGKKITHYRERYFNPDQRGGVGGHQIFSYAAKADAEEAIHQKISDICISMKADDYLELPDIVYNNISVQLDPKALRAYKTLERNLLLQVDEKTITAQTAATLSNKLLQLCNGAVYDNDHTATEVHDCKLELFDELIESLNGQPALAFYNFQHDVERLEKWLKKRPELRVRRLDTPEDEDAWNRREIDVLLAHPASAAYGLNLQDGGNHVIWFGLNWSLELYQQAIKRLHRQGQTQKVICHHLIVEGGRDEDVIVALGDKEATQDRLIDSLKARIRVVKGEVT